MKREREQLIVIREEDFRNLVAHSKLDWAYIRKLKHMNGCDLFIHGYQAKEAEQDGIKYKEPYNQFLKENGYIKKDDANA